MGEGLKVVPPHPGTLPPLGEKEKYLVAFHIPGYGAVSRGAGIQSFYKNRKFSTGHYCVGAGFKPRPLFYRNPLKNIRRNPTWKEADKIGSTGCQPMQIMKRVVGRENEVYPAFRISSRTRKSLGGKGVLTCASWNF